MNRRKFMSAIPAVAAAPLVIAASYSGNAPLGFHRLSVEKGDPGYLPYAHLRGDNRDAEIWLDGVEQRAITADAHEGWVKRYVRTERGNLANNGREVLTEIVHGRVTIKITD